MPSSSKTDKFFIYWLPPLIWCAGVLALSGDLGSSRHTLGLVKWALSWLHLSLAQLKVVHGYLRKTGHVLAYGILYFLWFRAFWGSAGYRGKKAFFWSLGLSLAVALLDEAHQSMFRTRGGSLMDVGLDSSAALLAALLTAVFGRKRPGSEPNGPSFAGQRQSP